MKKLVSLILCIVFVCLALVSCKQDEIGSYLPNYLDNKQVLNQIETLNFYIITGDNTSQDAKEIVPQHINTYLKEKYKIELNIKYYTESDYAAAVKNAIKSQDETIRPDIVLINSSDLFKSIQGNLLPLNNGQFNFLGNDFKQINNILKQAGAEPLLSASMIDGTCYTVPNSHTIGYYEYIVINKEMARDVLHFSEDKIKAMTTEESLEELKAAILATDSSLNVDDFVKIISNNEYDEYDDYEDFELLKRTNITDIGMPQNPEMLTDSEINFVNVMSRPVVTSEEAFESAFAIVKIPGDPGTYETEEAKAPYKNHYSKCMSIIYALNADAQFKNLLQYGYVGTNYSHEIDPRTNEIIPDRIVLEQESGNRYDMNPIHTGNQTIAYYCEELNWNETAKNNWLTQNANAVVPSAEESVAFELSSLDFAYSQIECDETITLPLYGSTYIDVDFIWTSDNENISVSLVNNATATLSFADVTEATAVQIKLEVVCGEEKLEKIFEIEILPAT